MTSLAEYRLEMVAVLVVLAVVLMQMARQGSGAQSSRVEPSQLLETDVVVVDVRSPEEYAQGHIPGAINIPVETLGSEAPPELPDPDQRIYVYCRTGRRSGAAAQALAGLGYTNVVDFGGIGNWTGELVTD